MQRSIRTAALALATTLVLAAGCAAGVSLPSGVVYPSITLDKTVTDDLTVNHSFTFEGKQQDVTVSVDGSLYAGAQQAPKSVVRFGDSRKTDWICDYYPAFVFDPAQDGFFSDLIGQMRRIRDAEKLDSDRYVELMTVFVQSLEYRTDPGDLSPKFPVETFVQRAGDCDDKTLLLGGMLAREGYDVAVLLFDTEQHVALGIRADALAYGDTGYALIETTAPGFVGMVPAHVGDGTRLSTDPQTFALGDGETTYTSAHQVAWIVDTVADLETRAAALAEKIAAADSELTVLEERARRLQRELDARASDPARYNALLPEYNAAVERYNTALAARNALVERYNAAVEAIDYVAAHLDDRPGVAAYLHTHAS
ncbi:MAG: hypothetical protein LLG24_06080 [Actinomycetia bacterium]|nr:hypothetical protein [Actinomycetes bacterium]